jgi:transposase
LLAPEREGLAGVGLPFRRATLALTDEQWAAPESLAGACRSHAKVPSKDLRRTMSAILWRRQNGAKWGAMPEEFGPWWMVA